jgi:hypothetical protein
MKRFWTAMTVTLLTIFVVSGCNDYGNTFQFPGGAALSFLSPSQVTAGSPDFTLTLTGTGFVKATKVQWNGKDLQTTVPTDSSGNPTGNTVTAVVPAALVANPGMATINTINPGSSYGGGTNGLSNTINFIINNPPNPVPTVTTVSPACATVGSDLALTITGTNFLNSSTDPTQVSTLNWTLGTSQVQVTAPVATITSTQITATIKAVTISSTGNATVTVSNPPSPPVLNVPGSAGSGGGTSTISPATTVTVQSTPCPVAAKSPANSMSTADVAEETPAVSFDGRYVAYTAVQDEHAQIFFRDTCEGAPGGCQARTSLLSVSSDGNPASGDSHTPSMSSDGRYVAFSTDAPNLVENAPPGRQVYLRDTCAGGGSCKPSTLLVSTDSGGALVGAESILPSVSSSGRFVAFLAVTPSHALAETKSSTSANSGYRQVFVRDTCLGAATCTPKTIRISLQPGDGGGNDAKPAGPAISGKAKHVALAGAKASTLFMRSVAVDDSVFLAIANDQR